MLDDEHELKNTNNAQPDLHPFLKFQPSPN
jgi:hypothetical protein